MDKVQCTTVPKKIDGRRKFIVTLPKLKHYWQTGKSMEHTADIAGRKRLIAEEIKSLSQTFDMKVKQLFICRKYIVISGARRNMMGKLCQRDLVP